MQINDEIKFTQCTTCGRIIMVDNSYTSNANRTVCEDCHKKDVDNR